MLSSSREVLPLAQRSVSVTVCVRMRFFCVCNITSISQGLLAPADTQQWMGLEALSLACACACTPRILLRVLRGCSAAPASVVSL
jgi:hypothetical protein